MNGIKFSDYLVILSRRRFHLPGSNGWKGDVPIGCMCMGDCKKSYRFRDPAEKLKTYSYDLKTSLILRNGYSHTV